MEISSSVGANSLQNGRLTIKAISPGGTWFKSNCLTFHPLLRLEQNGRNRIRLFGGFVGCLRKECVKRLSEWKFIRGEGSQVLRPLTTRQHYGAYPNPPTGGSLRLSAFARLRLMQRVTESERDVVQSRRWVSLLDVLTGSPAIPLSPGGPECPWLPWGRQHRGGVRTADQVIIKTREHPDWDQTKNIYIF